MNFYVKMDWLDYLNSNKYAQGSGYMHYIDGNDYERYDALGVLCQVYIDKNKEDIFYPGWWNFYDYIEKQAKYNIEGQSNIAALDEATILSMMKDAEHDLVMHYKNINPSKKPYFLYDETMYLPQVVCDWADIRSDPFIEGKRMTSAHDIFNLSFEDISRIIDREL